MVMRFIFRAGPEMNLLCTITDFKYPIVLRALEITTKRCLTVYHSLVDHSTGYARPGQSGRVIGFRKSATQAQARMATAYPVLDLT